MKKCIITTLLVSLTGATAVCASKTTNEFEQDNMNDKNENLFIRSEKAIERGVVKGYKAIENGVVKGYKGIENGVVKGYKAIEDAFVDTFFTEDPRVIAESAEVNAESVESAEIDE